jgi:chromate reductase
VRVLGISGSLRAGSHNSRLLRVAERLLPAGAELEVYGALTAIPPYDEDSGPPPRAVEHLRAAIAGADAVLVATPEYNASLPGVLKNALDWASRPEGESVLYGKPVAVVGASTGMFGAVWAQADARRVLSIIGARVIERELPIAYADAAFAGEDRLASSGHERDLAEILGELAECAQPGSEPGGVSSRSSSGRNGRSSRLSLT